MLSIRASALSSIVSAIVPAIVPPMIAFLAPPGELAHASGGGAPAIAHDESSCIALNGTLVGEDGRIRIAFRTAPVAGGIALISESRPGDRFIIDGSAHKNELGIEYQAACEPTGYRLRILQDGEVMMEGSVSVATDSVTSDVRVVNEKAQELGMRDSRVVYRLVR